MPPKPKNPVTYARVIHYNHSRYDRVCIVVENNTFGLTIVSFDEGWTIGILREHLESATSFDWYEQIDKDKKKVWKKRKQDTIYTLFVLAVLAVLLIDTTGVVIKQAVFCLVCREFSRMFYPSSQK